MLPHRRRLVGVLVLPSIGLLASACSKDPDPAIEDPERFELKAISGLNYAGRRIYDVGPKCEGKACPSENKYKSTMIWVDRYDRCVESADALDPEMAKRGKEEWCKIAPLASSSGFDFFFNNMPEPTSVELVRGQLENPIIREAYAAKTRLVRIEGPMTRYNGEYLIGSANTPSTVPRLVNLTCVENLSHPPGGGAGIEVNAEFLAANPEACADLYEFDGQIVPLRTQLLARDAANAVTKERPYFRTNNTLISNYGVDCTGASAPDTCCTSCDFELSVNVSRYGRSDITPEQAAKLEDPNAQPPTLRTFANAIKCDAKGNVYEECSGFVAHVDRTFENLTFDYDWDGDGTVVPHRIAELDRMREIHPSLRGAHESNLKGCSPMGSECGSLGLEGTTCIGMAANGEICANVDDPNCHFACRANWLVDCVAGIDGSSQGYCVDHRYNPRFSASCHYADGKNPQSGAARLANRDTNGDSELSPEEVCGGKPCDPTNPPGYSPVPNYDRSGGAPEINRLCRCIDPKSAEAKAQIREKESYLDICGELMDEVCKDEKGKPITDGRYAKRFVDRAPGLRLDQAVKGIRFYPADLGGIQRAHAEVCAVQNRLLTAPSIQDGWSTGFRPTQERVANETLENFDRGLCSGSEYRAVFATSKDPEHIEDKIGNTLDGRSVYVFQTSEFHVRPSSGFPADHLQISGCNEFAVEFSNKYDLSQHNLKKLQIWSLTAVDDCIVDGVVPHERRADPNCWRPKARIAGGSDCSEDPEKVGDGATPCLTLDVEKQSTGGLGFSYDRAHYGASNPFLPVDPANGEWGRYRAIAPGLGFDQKTGYSPGSDAGSSPYTSLSALAAAKPAGWQETYKEAFHDVCGMPLVTAGADDFYFDFDIDLPTCDQDLDKDGVAGSCDNAPERANRDQSNFDRDGFGDAEDLCPVIAYANNTDDSDKDGIGRPCDACRLDTPRYNGGGEGILDEGMWVRPNPYPGDFDLDGIGDVCDNCPTVPNCFNFGNEPGLMPADVTRYDAMAVESPMCQTPASKAEYGGKLGLACQDLPNVGFGPDEDFDQDGIANKFDFCVRIPLALSERKPCTTAADCPATTACVDSLAGGKVCNHFDSDSDAFGDICDTCAHKPNSAQNMQNPKGLTEEDLDADFIGVDCELGVECPARKEGRPLAFYEVSAYGYCCVTTLPADGAIKDPDGKPVQRNCSSGEDGRTCRPFPEVLMTYSGIGVLPAGCAEALTAAQRCDPGDLQCKIDHPDWLVNRRMNVAKDAGADLIDDAALLWSKMCLLPPSDQDFDGVADACDNCDYAFDPNNERYTDPNGVTWPNLGKYCKGDYDPKVLCDEEDGNDGTGTETGETGTSGEDEQTTTAVAP